MPLYGARMSGVDEVPPPPPPTRQTSHPGPRFGFQLPIPASDPAASRRAPSAAPPGFRNTTSSVPPVPGVDSATRTNSTASVASTTLSAPGSGYWGRVSTATGVATPTSPVPLRTSQVAQRAYGSHLRTVSRTYSVHDLNAAPPNEDSADEDGNESGDRPHSQHIDFPDPGDHRDLDIDEMSPDEDERIAEAALYNSGTPSSIIEFLINDTPKVLDPAIRLRTRK